MPKTTAMDENCYQAQNKHWGRTYVTGGGEHQGSAVPTQNPDAILPVTPPRSELGPKPELLSDSDSDSDSGSVSTPPPQPIAEPEDQTTPENPIEAILQPADQIQPSAESIAKHGQTLLDNLKQDLQKALQKASQAKNTNMKDHLDHLDHLEQLLNAADGYPQKNMSLFALHEKDNRPWVLGAGIAGASITCGVMQMHVLADFAFSQNANAVLLNSHAFTSAMITLAALVVVIAMVYAIHKQYANKTMKDAPKVTPEDALTIAHLRVRIDFLKDPDNADLAKPDEQIATRLAQVPIQEEKEPQEATFLASIL